MGPALLALVAAQAAVSPLLLHPKRPGLVRAAVTFAERPSPEDLIALARSGARPVETDLGIARVGRVVSVDVEQRALSTVARVRGVLRIDPIIPPISIRPLDVTAPKVGVLAARDPPGEPSAAFTGQGVIIADHEGGWDIFHPDFFFADGGRFDFEDTNGDGQAGDGDRIDLDGDGTFEAALTLLDALRENIYSGERISREPGYQPDLDWLFVDTNRNNFRDSGNAFAEDTPAYGEPIFTGEDVDGDGAVVLGERLLRLGTSKVRAVVVEGASYVRGQNLALYPSAMFDLSHGTGAIGIVAGGGRTRRYTGIAPDAELVLITSIDPIVGLASAEAHGADISFYEWNSPADLQDGSGPFDVAMDAAAAGMVQVAAAGNLAGSDHLMELRDLATPSRVDFTTDRFGLFSYRGFWLNVYWSGPLASMQLAIESSTARLAADGPYSAGVVDGIRIEAWAEETSRGFGRVLFIGQAENGGAIPEVILGLEVTPIAPVDRLRGLLFDDQSGWGKGVSWLAFQTDEGSALMPSTAPRVIAVGAYGGRNDLRAQGWGGVDERRAYSGMGPGIDGARVVDLSAPDDPYSPAFGSIPGVYYSAFGGTSGALPHVAGAAAVLLSSGAPRAHGAIEDILTAAARRDAFTGPAPSELYGFGKVDVASAIFGAPDDLSVSSPTIVLSASPAVTGQRIVVTAEVDQEGGDASDVQVAWDLGNDAILDEPLSSSKSFTFTPTGPGRVPIVGRAKNLATGRTAAGLVVVDVVEGCASAGCREGCCRSDGLCAECSDAGVGSGDGGVMIDDELPKAGGCGCSAGTERSGGLLFLAFVVSGLRSRRARAETPRA